MCFPQAKSMLAGLRNSNGPLDQGSRSLPPCERSVQAARLSGAIFSEKCPALTCAAAIGIARDGETVKWSRPFETLRTVAATYAGRNRPACWCGGEGGIRGRPAAMRRRRAGGSTGTGWRAKAAVERRWRWSVEALSAVHGTSTSGWVPFGRSDRLAPCRWLWSWLPSKSGLVWRRSRARPVLTKEAKIHGQYHTQCRYSHRILASSLQPFVGLLKLRYFRVEFLQ